MSSLIKIHERLKKINSIKEHNKRQLLLREFFLEICLESELDKMKELRIIQQKLEMIARLISGF